jgi:phospholipase/carboxylesterase
LRGGAQPVDVSVVDPSLRSAGRSSIGAAAVTVLLHGRGRSADEMIELAGRFELAAMAYLAPQAPGGSWYPQSFLAPVENNQPHLDDALERIERIVRGLERGGQSRRRIAFVGFSQGACLACEYVFRHPARWGGLVAIIGGLAGPPGSARSIGGSLDHTPIVLATSDPDPWVPAERVHETADAFRAMGGDVDLSVQRGADHAVTDESIAATRALLAALLV